MTTIDQQIAAYRAANPRSRARGLIKYVRNGTGVKQRGCVLCGELGPTWCGRYPQTLRARQWEDEHWVKHVTANALEGAK